ncbi:peptide chain release factor N(5)-glutamine methyltransferase [Fimbriiglobus ruber]|uniref:Release factor glutamine methyltransferase n=1 Tax=Fimbriiglobus ruber TaxID=1908690 RepID=A0A225D3Q2_9BACT|nr:peptide chain release factor N(5)-glutamine methyltransferase [Fimbriiglobus ruber]OWK36122.1 Protein-N(5)-glutamine methyltransferase PrmC [Fimbriiglobus ruber]
MSAPNNTVPQPPTVWTVKALLTWTTDFLKKKGVESPRLEAQLLLAHVLGCQKIDLFVRSEEEPADADRTTFKDLIRRRVEGWPVAYLIGQREFYLLPFEVTPAVLIPRPDTETLVLEALKLLKGKPAPAVLDLGTGSGCIAVSLAHQSKTARVTATDVSPDALDVARRNATRHGVADRIAFAQGDLFAAVPEGATFDLIASNPPYITPGELAELAPEVRDHEPRIALDGGPDGLAFYRRIAADAGRFLTPGGTVMVEVGWTQEAAVRGLFESRPEWAVNASVKDLGGRFRVVSARKK